MTLTYAGSLTLGQAVPMALSAQLALGDAVGLALPDIQARISGLLALSVQPPPSLADLIAGVTATLAALNQLLAAPLPDAGATTAALVDLQAQAAQLAGGLAFSLGLGQLLGAAGVHYYLFAGQAGQLGAELGALLVGGLPGGAGPNEMIAGSVLLANDGATIDALHSVLKS